MTSNLRELQRTHVSKYERETLVKREFTNIKTKVNERNASEHQLLSLVYFFCSTNRSGTEGIKHVRNSLPYLALYRVFLLKNM